MLDTLLAILVAVLPPCATEDSAWCTFEGDTVTVVNLAPADPAPDRIMIER